MKCTGCEAPIVTIDASVDPQAVSLRLTAQCGHVVAPDVARVLWTQGMRWTLPVIDGAAVITAERYRHVHEEGYTPEHDAAHDPDELTWAAWCLLDAAASGAATEEPPKMWPWGEEAWKPEHEPMRRLVIAGALIAAEIDRRLMEQRTQNERR